MMNAYLIRVSESEGVRVSNGALAPERLASDQDRVMRLGDAWAGLHVVLTAEPIIPREEATRMGVTWDDDSLENIFMGGYVTPFSSAFGPIRYLDPMRVRTLAGTLTGFGSEAFDESYDPDYLAELDVPPFDWDEDDSREWLHARFDDLKRFFTEAAGRGEGVVVGFD